MKALKKDLQSVVKNLKALTKQTERMAKKLNRLAKAEAVKKKKAKTRVKAKARVKAKPAKRRAVARKTTVKKAKRVPASDLVFKIIKRSRKGVGMEALKSKTGYKDKKIRDIIYRLKNQGKIKSLRAGIYIKL